MLKRSSLAIGVILALLGLDASAIANSQNVLKCGTHPTRSTLLSIDRVGEVARISIEGYGTAKLVQDLGFPVSNSWVGKVVTEMSTDRCYFTKEDNVVATCFHWGQFGTISMKVFDPNSEEPRGEVVLNQLSINLTREIVVSAWYYDGVDRRRSTQSLRVHAYLDDGGRPGGTAQMSQDNMIACENAE